MATLPEQFFVTAKKFPDKTALKYKQSGAYLELTFNELAKQIKTVAQALLKLGLSPTERVAVLAPNCPEWVMLDLGIMLAGGITVPIHTTFSPKLIAGVIKNSNAQILVVSTQEQLNKIGLIISEIPQVRKIIYLNADYLNNLPAKLATAWADFLCLTSTETVWPKIEAKDICSIIYTSGTTGEPKGVALTHKNFLSDAQACAQVVPVTKEDTLLSLLPLSHVFERTAGYYTPLLFAGATIAYAESFKEFSKNLREVNPTILVSVPRVFEKMQDSIWQKMRQRGKFTLKLFYWALKQPSGSVTQWLAELLILKKIRKALGTNFRFAIAGGSALSLRQAKFFNKIGLAVYQGYGLTEASPVVATNYPAQQERGTVGKALPGVEIKIANDKEILVRGPNVMKGYWEDDEATREALDEQGYLHTGDLGHLSNQGYLTIIGRKKEMIVTAGGKNFWPEILEEKLNETKYISQTMVIGNNRKHLAALIVPDWINLKRYLQENKIEVPQDEILNQPSVLQLYRQNINTATQYLAEYEKIIKFVLVVNEFTQEREELTPTLKLRRSVIATHYKKEIEQMYFE
ncbi:MAG: long-chain fatty acid--CoA ligase [Candidatus Buchananbacteria bacterium]